MTLLLWIVRLVLPIALVVGLFVDGSLDQGNADSTGVVLVDSDNAVPGGQSLTSTWYCPTAHSRELPEAGVTAQVELVLTNTAAEPTKASIYLVSPTSPQRLVQLEVPGLASRSLQVADHTADELVSALVEAPAPGIVAARRVRSPYGSEVSPCSSVVSDEWYVVSADTQADTTSHLVVFNPLPIDAVVDLSFASELEVGPYIPRELGGLVVPAASSLLIDIGEHVRRRDVVSATLRARLGRVVVDHIQAFDGSSGRVGFSAHLASATIATSWYHPVARLGPTEGASVVVSNPTDVVADIEVSIVTGEGPTESAVASVGPYDLVKVQVLPEVEERLVSNTVFTAAALFGILVRSSNGVPVVSGVELASGPQGSPGKESTENELLPIRNGQEEVQLPLGRESGLSISPGVPNGAKRWILAIPDLGGQVMIGLQNTNQTEATVFLSPYGSRGRYKVSLAGFGSKSVPLAAGSTIEVRSELPIAVTALHQNVGGAGLNSILGIKFVEVQP